MPILNSGRAMVQSMIDAAQGGEEFNAVPTEGSQVQCPSTGRNLTVRLQAAGDLNEVTLWVPPEATSTTGQRLFIRSDFTIGQLTVAGEPGVTVDNAMVNLAPGDSAVFYKFDTNSWSRL